MAITILELAVFRGAKEDSEGGMSGGEIERVCLPFMGGCGRCGACIAAYNASPSKSGVLMCSEGCIGDDGWDNCDEANRALFPEEYEWQGVGGSLSPTVSSSHSPAIQPEDSDGPLDTPYQHNTWGYVDKGR